MDNTPWLWVKDMVVFSRIHVVTSRAWDVDVMRLPNLVGASLGSSASLGRASWSLTKTYNNHGHLGLQKARCHLKNEGVITKNISKQPEGEAAHLGRLVVEHSCTN